MPPEAYSTSYGTYSGTNDATCGAGNSGMADTGVNIPTGVTGFHVWAWIDYDANSGDTFAHIPYAMWAGLPAIAAGDQEVYQVVCNQECLAFAKGREPRDAHRAVMPPTMS